MVEEDQRRKFKFEEILSADSGDLHGNLIEKFTLKSHMDSVRGAHILPGDTLATVSEDCMVKLGP